MNIWRSEKEEGVANNTFFGKDILTADQFTKESRGIVVAVARKMKKLVAARGGTDILKGNIMMALFYEPSSRTFGSFVAAMQRLGGGFIPVQGVTYSSVVKGETLPDTIRTFGSYSDIIVIRHSEVGSAKIAAEFSEKPVINAGDGVGEHPTQALLDYYTIADHFNSIDGMNVTLAGDLLNGRTIHSLAKLLSLHKRVRLNLVSPEILKLPQELLMKLKTRGVIINEQETLDDVLPKTDVLYVTRVQKERFSDLDIYEKLKHRYVITPETMKHLPKNSILMHPFPRIGEITMDVDLDPRAMYIREQMPNGMYIRMALLAMILKKGF